MSDAGGTVLSWGVEKKRLEREKQGAWKIQLQDREVEQRQEIGGGMRGRGGGVRVVVRPVVEWGPRGWGIWIKGWKALGEKE